MLVIKQFDEYHQISQYPAMGLCHLIQLKHDFLEGHKIAENVKSNFFKLNLKFLKFNFTRSRFCQMSWFELHKKGSQGLFKERPPKNEKLVGVDILYQSIGIQQLFIIFRKIISIEFFYYHSSRQVKCQSVFYQFCFGCFSC